MYFNTMPLNRLKQFLLGKPLNPFNPVTLRHISLIAFLAWVGLGADGLSSSCYGPEESYLALGTHTHLALFIAMAIAITVFVISIGYNQVIELFPSGGGGYKVASQLLGSYVGLISGAALLIDYVLTIAVSVASGMDAVFSFLPREFLQNKLLAEACTILLLILLNLRGMKESIKLLLPIFLGFVIVHFTLIVYGITAHRTGLTTIIPETINETKNLAAMIGWLPLVALLLHSYSLGSGTYTGIEAVSNNVNRLSEPRVTTGKWTMFYMALSLSFTAAGLIILYLLWEVHPETGKTLNAIVFQNILGDSAFGHLALLITLLLEAGLLLVAANSGFLAGPSVLANMAIDGWVPNRFRHLSTRLVVQNAIFIFGISALLILFWSHGKVSLLVILYSINVFITFSLSLLGLCVYWIKHRKDTDKNWVLRFFFSLFAFVLTSSILCITIFSKFSSGAWFTVVLTCILVVVCLLIRHHYNMVAKKLAAVDEDLKQSIPDKQMHPTMPDPHLPTAVILVGKHPGVGMHTLLSVMRMFPRYFKNFVFISVGVVDVESFQGMAALEKMREEVTQNLKYFVNYCQQYGIAAEYYEEFGTDVVDKLNAISERVNSKYSNCIFFSSKLVFEHDNWLMRLLHNETPNALQRSFHFQGKELVILPMKI